MLWGCIAEHARQIMKNSFVNILIVLALLVLGAVSYFYFSRDTSISSQPSNNTIDIQPKPHKDKSGVSTTPNLPKKSAEVSYPATIEGWRQYNHGSDIQFAIPENWFIGGTSKLEIRNPNQTIILTVEPLTFYQFQSDYCINNAAEKPRCELNTINEKYVYIDWAASVGVEGIFMLNEERGLSVGLKTADNQLTADAKGFFNNFLRTFSFGSMPNRALHITRPNGGETMCLNKNFAIEWENFGVNSIQLYLRREPNETNFNIGNFPANLNEKNLVGKGLYLWTVGQSSQILFGIDDSGRPRTEIDAFKIYPLGPKLKVTEGSNYRIGIFDSENSNIYDMSDNIFSIIACDG